MPFTAAPPSSMNFGEYTEPTAAIGCFKSHAAHLARDERAVGVVGDQHQPVGVGVAHAHQRRAEVLLVGLVALGDRELRRAPRV
jgi:hypothetical protein